MAMTLLIGSLLGFLAGLGTGGGSLLILWLTCVLELEPTTARSITLLFFLPTAIITCLFRWRQGTLQWRIILPGILSGSLTAALATWFSRQIDTQMLQKLFGGLLLIVGIKELFYRERNAR